MNHNVTKAGTTRIVFLDYLRVLACLMVIATHSCDSFYIGPGGVWQCASESDRLWISIIDSIMRAAVPLFVMTSSYLLLPLKDDNTTFFKRRFIRVLVPFAVWSCIYAFWPVLMGDLPASELPMRLLHPIWNFNDDSGHLWYIYMLIGLYLFMPVLSPWLKQTGKKAELAFLAVWFVSSFLAYLKEIGAGDMFGECYWNEFHSFWYFSGFIGYLVLAHYIRHHVHWNASRSLSIGLLCFLVGYAVTALPFYFRSFTHEMVQEVELTWLYCSPNVILMTFGVFMMCKAIPQQKAPCYGFDNSLSRLSYGVYLLHVIVLYSVFFDLLKGWELSTPAFILTLTVCTFTLSNLITWLLSKLPFGKYLVG